MEIDNEREGEVESATDKQKEKTVQTQELSRDKPEGVKELRGRERMRDGEMKGVVRDTRETGKHQMGRQVLLSAMKHILTFF